MLAIQYDDFGAPDILHLRDVATPEPGPGEVLVDLRAASVIPADWKLRAGHLKGMFPVTFPKIPGRDGVGIVSKLGEGVDYVSLGDPVCVIAQHTENGTHAQCIVRDRDTLVPLPVGMDFNHAAALMHAGICAWICLVEDARVQPGQRVLVQGGAGSIGSLGIQLAKHLGAHVTTTCRAANAAFVREMGADAVLAYDEVDFAATPDRFDVIFDLIGGDTHRKSYALLKPGGHMVCLRAAPIKDLSAQYGVTMHVPVVHDRLYAIEATVKLAEEGVFRPQIARLLPLAEAAEAQRTLEAGEVTRGRVVLEIPPR